MIFHSNIRSNELLKTIRNCIEKESFSLLTLYYFLGLPNFAAKYALHEYYSMFIEIYISIILYFTINYK